MGCRQPEINMKLCIDDSNILRLSSIELIRLMCGGRLRWRPMKYHRVSRSGCSCSLASLPAALRDRSQLGVPYMNIERVDLK